MSRTTTATPNSWPTMYLPSQQKQQKDWRLLRSKTESSLVAPRRSITSRSRQKSFDASTSSSTKRPQEFGAEITRLAPAPDVESNNNKEEDYFLLQLPQTTPLSPPSKRIRTTSRSRRSSISLSPKQNPFLHSRSQSKSQLSPPVADTRSAPTRRPPASHSSHGIETSHGPPPALITQRSKHTSEMDDYHDETDNSVVSTGTHSVWDELEDIKSRIRRLELTGRLPAASVEKPRALSASPAHSSNESATDTEDKDQEDITLRPSPPPTGPSSLLNSALEKTKPHLAKDVYRALEATVSDVIALAAMMGSTGEVPSSGASQASSAVGNTPSVSARQVRRKTDSICRNMTELCVAMTDTPASAPHTSPRSRPSRPSSRDASSTQPAASHNTEQFSSRFGRGLSLEPEDLPRAGSRVMSRLEARRSSMMVFGASTNARGTTTTSEANTSLQPHNPTSNSSSSRANRTSAIFRPRTTAAPREESPEVEPPKHSSIRPVSRAMTEVTHVRSPRERMSREYTSHHPLPEPPTASSQNSPSSAITPSSAIIPSSRLGRRSNYTSASSVVGIQTPPSQPTNHSESHSHTQSNPTSAISSKKASSTRPLRVSYDSTGLTQLATPPSSGLGLGNATSRRFKALNHTPRSPSHLTDSSNSESPSEKAPSAISTSSRTGLRFVSSALPSGHTSRRIPRPSLPAS
ncbi:MAG: hypothetical protein M1834_008381 [Cirrosporium novae-zelandiae]|nr:MAG: hypothetical protein M1834_008381 [Cirrosporium novae-zelandiae]